MHGGRYGGGVVLDLNVCPHFDPSMYPWLPGFYYSLFFFFIQFFFSVCFKKILIFCLITVTKQQLLILSSISLSKLWFNLQNSVLFVFLLLIFRN